MSAHNCACPHIDGRDCIAARTGTRGLRFLIGETDDAYDEIGEDECECVCHEEYAIEMRAAEDEEAAAWDREEEIATAARETCLGDDGCAWCNRRDW